MKERWAAALVALGSFTVMVTAAMAGSFDVEVDEVRVELSSLPEKPAAGQETTYTARLVDPSGAPVDGAVVTLQGRMADGMTVVAPLRATSEAGMYQGRVLFTMGGTWHLTLRVVQKEKRFELTAIEQVGR